MFKKRKAYSIPEKTNLSDKNIRKELVTPIQKQSVDDFDTDIENVKVMRTWIEQKLVIKAENKIMLVNYLKKRFWKDFLWMCLASLIITIGYDYFIGSTGSTGLFSEGLSAFAKLFAVLTYPTNITNQSSFYFVYYFAINVPLIIFAFIKLGPRFTFLTLMVMVLQIVFDQIITRIPEINPESLYMVINTQQLAGIPTAWNSTVWLFIKAICGGMIVGIGYGLPYRIGASSGGEDFIAFYIAKKYDKSIGLVNRFAYFATFFVAIIVNTCLLKSYEFNPDIKYGQVYNSTNTQLWHNLLEYTHANQGSFSKEALNVLQPFTVHGELANMDSTSFNNTIHDIVSGKSTAVNAYQYKEWAQEIVRTDFSNFTQPEINKMRFLFIFGPGVFASILLIIITTKFTDIAYPTHNIKTYLISTDKSKDLKTALINLGYRNNFINWNADTQIQQRIVDNEAVLVTMSVSNWKEIEDDLRLVDPKMTVNILKTDKVKGRFDYHLRSDRELKQTWQILKQDKDWLAEIKKEANVLAKEKHIEYLKAVKEVSAKYTFKNVKELDAIKTKEELDFWKHANLANIKNSKGRALLRLKHSWLVELADSQRQKDYVKRWFVATKKSFIKPDKTKVKAINKSYEAKLKTLEK